MPTYSKAVTNLTNKNDSLIKYVLFINGIVDIICAIVLIAVLPILGFKFPGYPKLPYYAAYIAGAWGIASLSFGVARIWASKNPKYYWFMIVIGLLEGSTLTLYSLGNMLWNSVTLLQAIIPLVIGLSFAIAYGLIIIFKSCFRKEM